MPVYFDTLNDEPRAAALAANAEGKRTVMQVSWSLVAGGAETYAFAIASNLDPTHFRTVICAVDQGGALEAEVRNSGVPFAVMNRRQGIDWRLMWRLFKLFRQYKVSIVQTHHFNQLFYSAIAAKLCGAEIIHTEHSVELYKRRRYRLALRLLSVLCRSVIAIGSDGARVLTEKVRIPRRKVRIIRAGVDIKKFKESRTSARKVLGLGESDKVVSIVARLYPEKNHLLLLRAFKDLVRLSESDARQDQEPLPAANSEKKFNEGDAVCGLLGSVGHTTSPGCRGPYRLLIVGNGIERERLANEIRRLGLQDSVQLLGVRRDVATILAASDVFVLPSDREGLPIAVLEAMAAAVPVVATAVGDLPSIVSDGVTGKLVPPGSKELLTGALAELLNDTERAQEMGRIARCTVENKYSLRNMIAEYETLLTQTSRR